MRKLFHKSVVILAIFMCCSLLLGIACKLDWNVAKASTGNPGGYINLTYQNLDDITYRSTESSSPAQITVFTHGLGGTPSHWSNQENEPDCGEYKFEYDDKSMPEQLRTKMEENGQSVVMFTVKVAVEELLELDYIKEDRKYYKTSLSEDEWKSEMVSDGTTNEKAGPESHQALYEKYFSETDESLENGNSLCAKLVELIEQTSENPYTPTHRKDKVVHSLTANDVSKHIILIFEAVDKDGSNDYVYAQLECILDVISYQYLQLKGVLPTYNMIAHSRGGLTNMQYALAHPYNVASLYSVGTPYNGSAFGSAALDIGADNWHPFLALASYSRNDVTYEVSEGEENIDECPSNFSPGVLDIIDEEIIESYKTYWNAHYDDFYSHIDFNPLGSYVTLGFILNTVVEYITGNSLLNVEDALNISNQIWEIVDTITITEEITEYAYDFAFSIVKTCVEKIGDILINIDGCDDLVKIVRNFRFEKVEYEHLGTAVLGGFVCADDLFIDLDSQIADGYLGRQVKVKLMDGDDQANIKKNVDNIGVAHNLEVHHPDIIAYIVDDLIGANIEQYSYRYENGGYHIIDMNIAAYENGLLRIPSTINNQPVIGIDKLTRNVTVGGEESVSSYHPEVTKVIIPASVEYISNYAFYGMRNLETVEFEEGSILEKVDAGAFMDCTSLKNITLPSRVWLLGTKAFANCTSLETFYVPCGFDYGSMVFAGCTNLTAFTGVGVEDGVIFNEDKTQLLYYPAKKGTSYIVPDTVTEIGAFAFAGGNTLTSIDLNNVTMIRMGAFGKCTSLTNITANNLEIIEGGIVDDTAWKAAQTGDKILLGDVLLSYQGTETDVVLENINSIAPYAFAGNENLESVTLTRGIISIGEHAFDQCKNLENVYICNNADVVQVMDAAFDGNAENRKIYVPYPFVHEYNTKFSWYDFNVHETVVSYDSKGGSACEGDTVYYQDYLTLPTPTREGYTFIGWYMNEAYTGDLWSSNARWNSLLDEVTLYAKWSSNSYNVVYNPEDSAISRADMGSESGDVEFGSPDYQFIVPTRRGYIFNGWFTERNGAGTQVSDAEGNGLIVWNYASDTAIYASWTVIEYTITYYLDGGIYENDVSNPETYTIETETFALYDPVKESYNFKGWFDELTGEKSNNTMIYQGSIGDKEYTAKYAQTYCIMFDSNFGSFCPAQWAEKNESILLPYSVRDGYTGKWEGIYEFGSMYTVTGEKWFVVEWTANTYTITFDNNGGTGGPTQATVQFEEAFPTIELPTKEGYCFDYYVTDDGGQYYMNGGTEDWLYYYNRDIHLTAHWTESFLAIENLGKSGTKWNIKITNNSSKEVTVEYNTKMCNASDAKNWTGLKNVQTFKLAPNGASATVTISENWFATSITVSYKTSDGIRRITYANELTSSGGINVKMVKIT